MILKYKSHGVTHPSFDSQIFDSLRLKAKLLTLGPHALWDVKSHNLSDLHAYHPSHTALLTVSQIYQPPHYTSNKSLCLRPFAPAVHATWFALPLIFAWWAPQPASSLCSQRPYF